MCGTRVPIIMSVAGSGSAGIRRESGVLEILGARGRGGRRTLLILQLALVFALVNADRLIQKEGEGGGSTDVCDDVLDSWLEAFMEKEALGTVVNFKRVDEGLEFSGVGSC